LHPLAQKGVQVVAVSPRDASGSCMDQESERQ
jgi:hypothetical protein